MNFAFLFLTDRDSVKTQLFDMTTYLEKVSRQDHPKADIAIWLPLIILQPARTLYSALCTLLCFLERPVAAPRSHYFFYCNNVHFISLLSPTECVEML